MNKQISNHPEKPCDNCPDSQTIDLVAPSLEYTWIAVMADGSEILQAPSTREEILFKDLDQKNIKKFSLRDDQNRDMFGIDVEERAFVVWGKYFRVDLPEGNYQVINIRRNQFNGDGSFERTHILGLKGEQERYLYIYPDKKIEFCWRFK